MKVRLRGVSTFVASGLLTMLIVSPVWSHGFPKRCRGGDWQRRSGCLRAVSWRVFWTDYHRR